MSTAQKTDQYNQVIHLADNSLILGQRMGEWCGHAPALEEDLAMTNMALDLIGQARMLLQYVQKFDEQKRSEDQLAFLRTEPQFRNFTMCELPNHNFARTMMRMFLFAAWQSVVWESLINATDTDSELAAIAAKSIKETKYHVNHSGAWVVRLGDGTAESAQKAQAALNYLWPYCNEFFEVDAPHEAAFLSLVTPVIAEAKLNIPKASTFKSQGKKGMHSEHMGHLLAQMQYMQRTYPNQVW